ncbi:MAG: hypothetical protein KTR31_08345 [Myxococcales bacterium]|nr:hypothetical protein [Myxococcales bacterium]
MTRNLAPLLVMAFVAAGCGGPPLCGVDGNGDELPICVEPDTNIEYCPQDHWAAENGCSCACDDNGQIVCNDGCGEAT